MQELKQENQMLKQNLLTLQEHMKNCIDGSLMSIQRTCKNKEMKKQFNGFVNEFMMTSNVSMMQLNMPSMPASNMYILTVFKENMQKFTKFVNTVLSPATLSNLIQQFGTIDANQVTQSTFQNALIKNKAEHDSVFD